MIDALTTSNGHRTYVPEAPAPEEAHAATGRVFVELRVGDESYALPVEHVLEVTELHDATPLPGGPAELLGLLNLRGRVLPVYELAAILGASTTEPASRLVVATDGRRRAGLAVHEVVGVGPLPESAGSETDLLAGSVLADDRLVGVLDVERLLGELERVSFR